MRFIDKIAVQNDTGMCHVPAEPLPTDAILITSDAEKYTIYELGDELPPPPEPDARSAIYSAIEALEAKQTPRLLRNAALGDSIALDKLEQIETEIAALRAQL